MTLMFSTKADVTFTARCSGIYNRVRIQQKNAEDVKGSENSEARYNSKIRRQGR